MREEKIMKNFKKGFTLIELLVVVAIIGILASVVLGSLNTARAKGADAAVKANLANIRAQAQLVYDADGDYTNVCANPTIASAMSAANTATGVTNAVSTDLATAGSATQSVCHVSADGLEWAANVPLKTSNLNSWCVDNTGSSKELTGAYLAASITACQ